MSDNTDSDNTTWFRTRQLDARTWVVDDRGQDLIYLACGEERCLLIDTGWGVGDLPALVASLCSLPLTVVNTHGHPDHTFGNGQFAQVHVPAADLHMVQAPPPLERRRWIAGDLLPKPLPHGFDVGTWASTVPELLPIEDGHLFDLGGRTLEVVAIPGHSPGSMCLLDRQAQRLFTGDSVLGGVHWLHLEESRPLSEYLAGLRRIRGMADRFEAILPAHGTPEAVPLSKQVLADLIDGVASILSGESVGREVKTFAGDGLRCDFGSCGVLYRGDRL
jgi:glyoxylase-like metal-dependent hydrolase (beta-lactamase superfamily II)